MNGSRDLDQFVPGQNSRVVRSNEVLYDSSGSSCVRKPFLDM